MLGLAAVVVTVLAALGISAAAGRARHAHAAASVGCPDAQYPAQRDPSNPLMLRHAPGTDPLNGARFFVDGPGHGAAAGAIAQLLGIDPGRFPDSYSWARFERNLEHGSLHRRLQAPGNGLLRYQVHLLEKIAAQPVALRFSKFSGGGGPGAILHQVQRFFCHKLSADRGSIPIINTYFAHPDLGNCASHDEMVAATPTFRRQVDEVIAGTGRRPAVFLLEMDAFGSSSCMARRGTLGDWENLIRYEVDRFSTLPHVVVYIEAGYSDSNSARYTARALNHVDISRIRGFYTNDTHLNWTIDEVRWGERVSRLTHGAHFIVNTAQNGNGPKHNPHPVYQGNEDLCNPPGRGLGPRLTVSPGFANVDALMWTTTPGNSSGYCRGGTASGTFWTARAMELAAHANGRLGPRFASDPY
jgi:endoglucanase